jgi:hypothetical protein
MAFRLAHSSPHGTAHHGCTQPLPPGVRYYGVVLNRFTDRHFGVQAVVKGMGLGREMVSGHAGEGGGSSHEVNGPHVHLYVDDAKMHYLVTADGTTITLGPGRHHLRSVLAGQDHCEYPKHQVIQEVHV